VTPTWVTIVVAIASGFAGSILSTWLRGHHEARSWLRDRILDAGRDFSRAAQNAFGPVQEAIKVRFDEPEEVDEDGIDDDVDELDFRDYWHPETIQAYEDAKAAVLGAESALGSLLLLFADESVAIVAANRTLSMLGTAVGSLEEIPRDAKSFSDLYQLHAQLEWHSFNEALRRELPRAGRRRARWRVARERRRYEQWVEEKVKQMTHVVDGETRLLLR
jgi:hypothetical protein